MDNKLQNDINTKHPVYKTYCTPDAGGCIHVWPIYYIDGHDVFLKEKNVEAVVFKGP